MEFSPIDFSNREGKCSALTSMGGRCSSLTAVRNVCRKSAARRGPHAVSVSHKRHTCDVRQFSRLSTTLIVTYSALLLLTCIPRAMSITQTSDPSAKRLHFDLMNSYKTEVKPSGSPGDPKNKLTVKMGMRLSQVLDVDEKNQIITISVWLRQEWYDSRLKWDPSEYDGVTKMNIPSDSLWKPDIVLYNNADGDFVVTLKTKATVYHDGKIVWEPPAIYKSYCPIDVEFFPFDIQECFLKFGTWTYNGDEVDLMHVCNGTHIGKDIIILRGIDLKDYYKNVEWDVINVTARRKVKFYPCCPEPYPDITFNITLRRRTLFYTLNLIVPCISISCLTVLVFYLPSDSGEKITLSISILLALTVFFLLLSDMNPPTSLVIPLIGKYLLFIMIVVTASIFLTVYTLHINFKTPSTGFMSPWVRKIFTEILPRALFMKRPEMASPPVAKPGSVAARTVNGIETRDLPQDASQAPYENIRQRVGSRESMASSSRDGGTQPQRESMTSSSREGTQLTRESMASSSREGTQFPPEVLDALKGVKYIANHLRQGDKDLLAERDWKYICMVIDRLFLYIFTTATLGGTLSIFLYAPSLYDPRLHIERVDSNSTCQY